MKARRKSHKLSRDYKINRLVNPIAEQEPEEQIFNVKLERFSRSFDESDLGWQDTGHTMPRCTEDQIHWLNLAMSRSYFRIIKA
jgi:hypothetical protein